MPFAEAPGLIRACYSTRGSISFCFFQDSPTERHSPSRRVLGGEVDIVSHSPQQPRDDDVVQGMHDYRQEQAFLELERDGVVPHGPVTPHTRETPAVKVSQFRHAL